MVFANPLYLLLLLLIIPVIAWYILKQKRMQAALQVSTTQPFDKMPRTYKIYLRHFNFVLRVLAVVLLIIALARPQSTDSWQNSSTEGVDIVLALDISGSMLARDFKPDRVEAAKDVAAQFVSGREHDNIGLVIFAGESFTMCPMTTDHAVLLNLMKDVHCGMVDDGTAIGDGLATAINRIKDGPAKSKTIILLTDGTNNAGDIAPATAAQIAKSFGIHVYTIGVGTKGLAPTPVQTPYGITYQNMPVEMDEEALKQIAETADGKYFRATNKNVLKGIFEEIDKLEKTKLTVKEFSVKEEEYTIWALMALLCLGLEIVLRHTLLKIFLKQKLIMFRFAQPEYLYLLIIVPILWGLFIYGRYRSRRNLAKYGNPSVLAPLMTDVSKYKPWIKFIIQQLAFIVIVFMLARPQFGSKLETVKKQGVEIMIALDVSNSMMAKDIAPNRLEKAKMMLSKLVDELDNDKIGLIVFAGDAYTQLPITSDFVSAKMFLNTINPNMVPTQGTAIGRAISTAMNSFTPNEGVDKAIIVITDAENHEDDAVQWQKLRPKKILK